MSLLAEVSKAEIFEKPHSSPVTEVLTAGSINRYTLASLNRVGN